MSRAIYLARTYYGENDAQSHQGNVQKIDRAYKSAGNRPGRGRIGVLPLKTLPVLDVTALTGAQLDAATQLFKGMAGKNLLPIYRLHEDPVRRDLDERFGREILGLPVSLFADGGPIDLLRKKTRGRAIRARQ